MPRTVPTSSDGQRERRQDGTTADQTNVQQLSYLSATSCSTSPYLSPYAPQSHSQLPSVPALPSQRGASPASSILSSSASIARSYTQSVHSSSSREDVIYDLPGPRDYTFDMPVPDRALSRTEQARLVGSLRAHSVNTLTELCRVEDILFRHDMPDVSSALTDAWAYYINSNSLLNELRGLTRNFPFSSGCLDEARLLVDGDFEVPDNYCCAVMTKIRDEGLIPKHALIQALDPAMWGGRSPTPAAVDQLTNHFVDSWTDAVNKLLRYWDERDSETPGPA